MHAEAMACRRLENDLRRAIESDELELCYQPIVVPESGQLAGFEALIRWMHPERGPVLPQEFIPAAEENGLIVPIGRWVLQEACGQLSRWKAQVPAGREFSISVNVSRRLDVQVMNSTWSMSAPAAVRVDVLLACWLEPVTTM
jgi:EAL domain-containing protein (putative c-di-GMP-specific phosphodiesterase class I)